LFLLILRYFLKVIGWMTRLGKISPLGKWIFFIEDLIFLNLPTLR
jgi:hypothetical protein